MKKYCKHLMTGALFALFLGSVLPSLAITFNEPRKVIIPTHANAVYGSLNVRDKMILNYNTKEEVTSFKNDAFMVEIGQRPLYFWDNEKKRHRLQVQDLYLNKVSYQTPDGTHLDNDNVYTIGYVEVPNGSFVSEDLFFRNTGSSVNMRGVDAKLFLSFRNPLPTELYIGAGVTNFNVIAHDLNFFDGEVGTHSIMEDRVVPTKLSLRDYAIALADNTVVPFPSPRMIIFNNSGTVYTAKGTSTSFQLVNRPGTTLRHYYGPWQVVAAPNGIDINTSSCPSDNKCYKVLYGNIAPGGDIQGEQEEPSGGNSRGGEDPKAGGDPKTGVNSQNTLSNEYDTDNRQFTCADEIYNEATATSGNIYNPNPSTSGYGDTCYDYQLVSLPVDSSGKPVYDSNSAAYEFNVQEMFIVKGSSITVVSQNPRFREKPSGGIDSYDINPISFSTTTSSTSWTLAPKSGSLDYFQINGQRITASFQKHDEPTYNDMCFELCNGKLCSQNIVYVKSNREGGAPANRLIDNNDTDPNPIVSHPLQGPNATVVTYTYTVGYCPANSNNTNYTNSSYEMNLAGQVQANMIAGLVKKTGSSAYQAPKVCLKRKVRCNVLDNTTKKSRSYKLLSVNY